AAPRRRRRAARSARARSAARDARHDARADSRAHDRREKHRRDRRRRRSRRLRGARRHAPLRHERLSGPLVDRPAAGRVLMRRAIATAAVSAVAAASILLAGCGPEAPGGDLEANLAVVDRYCTGCHNDAERAADLSFDGVTAAHVAQHPDVWEKAVRKLRGHLMPPAGEPRPDQDTVATLVTALETSLDRFAAERGPAPG